jgi:hypothetical protein
MCQNRWLLSSNLRLIFRFLNLWFKVYPLMSIIDYHKLWSLVGYSLLEESTQPPMISHGDITIPQYRSSFNTYLKYQKYSSSMSFTKFCSFEKKLISEIFSILNYIICAKVAKVLWYFECSSPWAKCERPSFWNIPKP